MRSLFSHMLIALEQASITVEDHELSPHSCH
jgi:hypothetical protein